jgi:hypothetical protein
VKIDLQQWLDEPFLKKEKPPNIGAQVVIFNLFLQQKQWV